MHINENHMIISQFTYTKGSGPIKFQVKGHLKESQRSFIIKAFVLDIGGIRFFYFKNYIFCRFSAGSFIFSDIT